MTIDEASERYNIPVEVLKEYESWGLCGEVKKVMGTWQYDEMDLQRLSMIMTLHDIGFSNEEVESYMRLLLEGSGAEEERLNMLKKSGVLRLMKFISNKSSWIAWIICGTKSKKHKKSGGYHNEKNTFFSLYCCCGIFFDGLWRSGWDGE